MKKLESKFQSIVENYINGNITDYKMKINKLSKVNLIRLVTYINYNYSHLAMFVNSYGEIIICEK